LITANEASRNRERVTELERNRGRMDKNHIESAAEQGELMRNRLRAIEFKHRKRRTMMCRELEVRGVSEIVACRLAWQGHGL